jgi:hypothetical protein
MMIDFAVEAKRNEGMAPSEAIHQACLLRLRPILMTTMAALLGALPLMVGGGTGSELRQPLGIAIVGGLIVSQVLTLFTTPVIYLAFDSIARRFRGRDRRAPAEIWARPDYSPPSWPGLSRPSTLGRLSLCRKRRLPRPLSDHRDVDGRTSGHDRGGWGAFAGSRKAPFPT